MKKVFGIVALIPIVFILVVLSTIYLEVKSVCNRSVSEYKLDCQNSLIKALQDHGKTFKERNDAVWVLGQMAKKESRPVLKSFYKGVPEEREPLDKTLSQYEIKKAITWCEQGNWTSWMYVGL